MFCLEVVIYTFLVLIFVAKYASVLFKLLFETLMLKRVKLMMKGPKEVSDAGCVQEFQEKTQLLFSPKLTEPFLSMF